MKLVCRLLLAASIADATKYKQVLFKGPNPDHDHPTCSGEQTRITPTNCHYNLDHYELDKCFVICGGWGVVGCRACEVVQKDNETITSVNYVPKLRVEPGPNATCANIKRVSTPASTDIPTNKCLPFGPACAPSTPNCHNGSTSVMPCVGDEC